MLKKIYAVLNNMVIRSARKDSDDLPTRRILTDLVVEKSRLEAMLNKVQDCANHMNGEWDGGHIRFSSERDQRMHAKKNYDKLTNTIKEARELLQN